MYSAAAVFLLICIRSSFSGVFILKGTLRRVVTHGKRVVATSVAAVGQTVGQHPSVIRRNDIEGKRGSHLQGADLTRA
jgi:hypothetical protein